MAFIEVQNVTFEYPGKKALDDVSFSIPEGSVVALVGPNGAGKTTLMRCLVALDQPQSGKIIMNGVNVEEDPRAVHAMCGYLSDFFGLYDALSVRQCLTYAAWSQNLPAGKIAKTIDAVAEQTELVDMLEKKAGDLSRGYRQRLGIAMALIHDPKVLILDEPASGMDPEARIGLSRLMRRLRHTGKTIIVSSHILNELEDYCTAMLVIRDGKMSEHVTLKDFSARAVKTLRIVIAEVTEAHMDFVSKQPHVSEVRIEEGIILCAYAGSDEEQRAFLKALVAADIPVLSFEAAAHRLYDAYMNISTQSAEKK